MNVCILKIISSSNLKQVSLFSTVLKVKNAIYIIMGANIGTTVTNTIVSLGQSIDRDQFRRAFAAATVHDMFNVLCVIIFLPLEAISGYLFYLSQAIVDGFNLSTNKDLKQDYLKKITKPFENAVIQIDKKIIEKIAKAKTEAERLKYEKTSLLKVTCVTKELNITLNNTVSLKTNASWEIQEIKTPCDYWFHGTTLSDTEVGAILLVCSLLLLCICLICIVKLLHSMLKGQIAVAIRKVVNTDFPKPFGFLTGYLAIIVGAVLTFLVQSSSIFTSAITPLVGIGVISLDRMYPLTLGSNIGTTTTAILAAFAAGSDKIKLTLQVALCHLFFNISGILIWYPIPFMRQVPIKMAKGLGNTTAEYRWFAIFYIFLIFFIVPGIIFGLSVASWKALVGVAVPVCLFFIVIAIINCLQNKKPESLPPKLQTWEWAPRWTRSLEPYDRVFKKGKEVMGSKVGKKITRYSFKQNEPRETNNAIGNAAYTPDDVPEKVIVEKPEVNGKH